VRWRVRGGKSRMQSRKEMHVQFSVDAETAHIKKPL